jgi:hypothetical protein
VPALQLVEAYRQPDGNWQTLPPTMESKQAVPSEAASWAEEQLRSPGSDILQVSAQSLSGPEDQSIAWFMAARVSRPPARVIVVAIEGGNPEDAVRVGLSLLP